MIYSHQLTFPAGIPVLIKATSAGINQDRKWHKEGVGHFGERSSPRPLGKPDVRKSVQWPG